MITPANMTILYASVNKLGDAFRKVAEVINRFPNTNIQRRTHRKKRINKKWLKRYGTFTIFELIERRGK